ncbi:sarcalumenin isoform X2 [Monomorium pharaonis]|uniref:sarcalumenin isoform X2 n=1 Tax=Monomorium pharaonis TaxID=307658 RepID=UPI001746889C|nr:sarcalumenin isoform X2 [Monomorium pharaonis]
MTGARMRPALVVGLLLSFLAVALRGVQCEDEQIPSEDLCRPYIEKALKDLGTGSLETSAEVGTELDQESHEEASPASEETGEAADDASKEETKNEELVEESAEETADESKEVTEEQADASEEKQEAVTDESAEVSNIQEEEEKKAEEASAESDGEQIDSSEKLTESKEVRSEEDEQKSDEEIEVEDEKSKEEKVNDEAKSEEEKEIEDSKAEDEEQEESKEATEGVEDESEKEVEEQQTSTEASVEEEENDSKAKESAEAIEDQTVNSEDDTEEEEQNKSTENEGEEKEKEGAEDPETVSSENIEEKTKSTEEETETKSTEAQEEPPAKEEKSKEEEEAKSVEEDAKSDEEENEDEKSRDKREVESEEAVEADGESEEAISEEEQEPTPEEDLIQEIEIPENLRPRDHINQLLKLDEENEEKERAIQRAADIILRDLKRLYDNAIKPLETMYKYRDLSNRHFGDPEIFSKPLVLFMGPWSGGKSSIVNYLLDIEYKPMSLRTGAEPSPAYFNIIMHGEEEEVLDGTQLAADWTFSGLQKFGQGLLDRLRGLRLNNKLLEKVNIVEIPGILEIRKQVQRLFPFNDACQWFIDRADIIFLVYDPAKLDVGPETEAILDQLKGREYQTRIILNKADQVKPEELMRVQGALIWNISPLMSSAEPPIMYSTSLWSLPYEAGAPTRLLYAQERAFLRDLRSAIDKRVEHKIASARRFAVRVRNHAKMVDCYLTTYYNHKTFFGNKREISDKIIENPQDYHIYEGLSTLTNISRYDLPDPDVYRDFFRLNPLYDFPLLSSTCTYFRGCPINRLDVAIAYDLPELVGNYKKSVETALHESEGNSPSS